MSEPITINVNPDRMVEIDLKTGETVRPEAEDAAADEQEAAATPPEHDDEDEDEDEDEDAPEAETPQKPKKAAPPSMEERMLEMLLREKHPDTLKTALAKGKTIRGAWNYVVSVMKNAYITAHGRTSGGMCGTPDVVVGIAERYLREFPEGYTEPEAAYTPKKKPAKSDGKAEAAKTAVATVKAAATAAKKEAKKKDSDILGKAPKNWQPTLF